MNRSAERAPGVAARSGPGAGGNAATNVAAGLAYVAAGQGPAVVLIHGMGSSHRQWGLTVPALIARHRVVSIDLPGFGGSPMPAVQSFGGFADAVAALIRELALGSAALVGHSFGGMVAVDLADRYPELVRQAVLVASAGMHSGAHRITWVWKLFRLIGPVLGPIFANRLTARLFLRVMAARTTPKMIADTVWSARRARAMWRPVRSDYDFRGALARVSGRVPLSLIWGDRDRIVPLADGQAMQRATGAELAVIEGVGHLPMYEDSAAFNRILSGMLARTGSPDTRGDLPGNWSQASLV